MKLSPSGRRAPRRTLGDQRQSRAPLLGPARNGDSLYWSSEGDTGMVENRAARALLTGLVEVLLESAAVGSGFADLDDLTGEENPIPGVSGYLFNDLESNQLRHDVRGGPVGDAEDFRGGW